MNYKNTILDFNSQKILIDCIVPDLYLRFKIKYKIEELQFNRNNNFYTHLNESVKIRTMFRWFRDPMVLYIVDSNVPT